MNRDDIRRINPELGDVATVNETPDRPVTDKPLRFRFERKSSPSPYWRPYLATSVGQWRGQYARVVCAANMREAMQALLHEFPNARKA